MSDAPKCRTCGGWGRGLVKQDGLCDHCRNNAPSAGQKRPRPSDSEESSSKRAREMDEDELKQMLDAADAIDAPEWDTTGVKKMLLTLEKRISANMLQRSKHSDDPKSYLESEVQLDSAVKSLNALAAVPEQYTTLVGSDSLGSLLGLLVHENSDIAIDVLQLFNELLKEDAIESATEAGEALARALIDGNTPELLVAALRRLDDEANGDDAMGMFAACELFLSLVDICGSDASIALCAVESKPSTTTGSSGSTPGSTNGTASTPALLDFCLNRAARKDMDDIKGISAELLAVLLSSSDRSAGRLGGGSYIYLTPKGARVQVDGVEYLLQILNGYKKKMPDSMGSAEKEVVENVMDALCSCLLLPANQARFLAAEGLELLLRAIHENGFARAGSLKVLDYAGANHVAGIRALVEAGGLKAVFPAFMGKGLAQTKRWHGAEDAEAEEERATSTVASCLHLLLPPPSGDAHPSEQDRAMLTRVLVKFMENGGEKIDRLLELRAKYSSKVQASVDEDSAQNDDEEEEGEDAEVKVEMAYIKRMEAGLFTLQRIDLTLARLVTLPSRLALTLDSKSDSSKGAAAGAGNVTAPALLTLARELAFTARSKMYEQGASIVSLMDTLQEHEGRLGSEDSNPHSPTPSSSSVLGGPLQDKEEVHWMLSTLQVVGGLVESSA